STRRGSKRYTKNAYATSSVKAYEFAPNEFAAIEPQEIKAAEVETSDTIDLFHFVNGADVDPIYFEHSYYVAPDSGAEKVYALLLEAMRREECFGIARIGMHRREHMLILRPTKDCLVAHTNSMIIQQASCPGVGRIVGVTSPSLTISAVSS